MIVFQKYENHQSINSFFSIVLQSNSLYCLQLKYDCFKYMFIRNRRNRKINETNNKKIKINKIYFCINNKLIHKNEKQNKLDR